MADGRVLAGRYAVESVLGKGGMAQVYLGTDRVLGRQVALKVLGAQFTSDASFVARFRREAQAAAALNHPNVVSVFDTGSDDGTHFIVMEYVQGRTLAEVIREDAPLLPERAAEIAEAVAVALAFAHRAGIIHRDVKPGNIMLTPTGDVKVMDFGIARATTSESLTQTATVLGTATYFSPEQAQGEAVDARSDIYSLGCVLYELLTGHPPFSGDSPVAVAYKHVKEDAVPPSRLNPDVPPALDAIVLRALAKNPANRYPTAEGLAEDLERFRSGTRVMATPVLPPVEHTAAMPAHRATTVLPAVTTPETGRRRWWIAALVLLAILALLGAGLLVLARSLIGSNLKAVPDVRGLSLRAATLRLNTAGFRRGTVAKVDSPSPTGQVVDYRPREAKPGSAIALRISNGSQVPATVPDVTCQARSDAIAALNAAGFKVRFGGTASNNLCNPGEVAKEQPPGNSQAAKGSSVQIFLVPEASPSPSPSPSPPPPPSPSPSPLPSPSPPSPSPPSPSPPASASPSP